MTILTASGSFAKSYTQQFKTDINSIRELGKEAFEKKLLSAKTVIHNAATIDAEGLELYVSRNFDFTRYIVSLLEKNNPNTHLIFLSSMSILDPQDDSKYGDVVAMSPYAYSKYLAETYCLKSSLNRVSCVRFSTIFYQDPAKDGLSKLTSDAVNHKKITLFNGGAARRNFLPLHIAAQYVHKIAESNKPGKHIYNLSAPRSTSFHDIAEMIKQSVSGLQIDNKKVTEPPLVLSEFGLDTIKLLGPIGFSLDDELKTYIKSLQL